jgi:hypothetical protein
MSAFYFFSGEQLKKLKTDDLLKLAGYYHVTYNIKKPDEETIIKDIILAQEKVYEFLGASSSEPEPSGMSVRVRRIRETNRKEE